VDGVLTLTVADDGAGAKARAAGAGHGLGNIAARLGEIGGTCVASAGAEGFRLVLRMPVAG